jgi:hypothetical protein
MDHQRDVSSLPTSTALVRPGEGGNGDHGKNESIQIIGLRPSTEESSRKPSRKFPSSRVHPIFIPGDTPRDQQRIDKARHDLKTMISSLTAASTETTLGPLLDPDRMSASRTEHLISGATNPL